MNKRATVYFDPDLHRALKLKAIETDQSLSELVNDAVRQSLREDADDITTFENRISEPDRPFEEVVKQMRADGVL